MLQNPPKPINFLLIFICAKTRKPQVVKDKLLKRIVAKAACSRFSVPLQEVRHRWFKLQQKISLAD